jgi:hypothetical protein
MCRADLWHPPAAPSASGVYEAGLQGGAGLDKRIYSCVDSIHDAVELDRRV